MLITRLVCADIPYICQMASSEAAFEVAHGDTFWTPEQLAAWIENEDDVLLVARHEAKIVGFALSTLHRPTGKATWENLWVDPAARGLGVGTELTETLVYQLEMRGAKYICFFVRAENLKEVTFFEKRSFTRGHNFVWFGKHI